MTEKKYKWHTQSVDPASKIIECFDYDPLKDFKRDPTGFYLLIRVDYDHKKIEVAVCNAKHVIVKAFRGGKSQDLYEGIFRYEKQHRLKWFADKGHCAYLGKELKKAELSLISGENNYFQE